MKILKKSFILGIIAICVCCLVYNLDFFWKHVESNVLSIIKQEELLFLATDKITTQVVSQIDEKNIIFGHRKGTLIATVVYVYGFDLNELTQDSLSREDNTIVIKLPDPKELVFSIKPSSIHYILDTTLVLKFFDMLSERDVRNELNKKIEADAISFMHSNDLVPSRDVLVKRMNRYANLLASSFSVLGFSPINFEFR